MAYRGVPVKEIYRSIRVRFPQTGRNNLSDYNIRPIKGNTLQVSKCIQDRAVSIL
jgi:hypothetical protein